MNMPTAYEAGADQLAALLRDYYDTCKVNLHNPVERRVAKVAHQYFHGLMAVLLASNEQSTGDTAPSIASLLEHLQAELVLHVVAATSLFGDSE